MHSDDLPAVEFSDGWNVYAVHGVMVDEWIIAHPEQITPEKINAEKNAEERRVMMSKFGWDRMLEQVGAKCVDRHPEPTIGELWKWTEPDNTPMAVIHVQNGTPESDGSYRWYSLRVRPEFNNVVDAVKSTYPACQNMTREEYLIMNGCRS